MKRVYVLTILDINTDDRGQDEVERQIFKAIDNGFVNGDVRESDQQSTIVTGYTAALDAYNAAVADYDRAALDYQLEGHSMRLWEQLQAAERHLIDTGLRLAADVRLTHEG